MYQVLYRKYRPKELNEVVGQKVIIKTLINALNNDKISHAYLFAGPRGTGKTSIAKIFAKLVNCENTKENVSCGKCVSCTQSINNQNTDIIEIDAASNNGVDEIRELREKVNLVPSFGKYKVYIIDEVHMLTTAAFNALLKTLEEPPKHIIFILATTDPHKIPQTILSRCQRFDFKKISDVEIFERLKEISNIEKINIEDDAIKLIANLCDGGMRDSISLLDQLSSYTSDLITINDVNDVYGVIAKQELYEILEKIYTNDMNSVFKIIEKYNLEGKNLIKISEMLIDFLKNTLIYSNDSNFFENTYENENYSKILNLVDEKNIYESINILLELLKTSKNTNNSKLLFELSIIQIINKNKNNKNNNSNKEMLPIIEKKQDNIKNKEISLSQFNEKNDIIEKLKKIRINNALYFFDKKNYIEFKENIGNIKDLILDTKYSSIISLILDGELKIKGKDNIVFVYKNNGLVELFNNSIVIIEELLNKVYNENLKPISITEEEWNIIKTDFNNSLKNKINNYKYIEENIEYKKQMNNDLNIASLNNEIDNMFNDLVVYE